MTGNAFDEWDEPSQPAPPVRGPSASCGSAPTQAGSRLVRIAEANSGMHGFAGSRSHALAQHRPGTLPSARLDRLTPLTAEPVSGDGLPPAGRPPRALIAWLDRHRQPRRSIVDRRRAAPFALDAGRPGRCCAAARPARHRVDRAGTGSAVMVPRTNLNVGSAATVPPNGDLAFVTRVGFDRQPRCSTGQPTGGSASRASSPWAKTPTSSSAISSTISPSTLATRADPGASGRHRRRGRFMSAGGPRPAMKPVTRAQGGAADRSALPRPRPVAPPPIAPRPGLRCGVQRARASSGSTRSRSCSRLHPASAPARPAAGQGCVMVGWHVLTNGHAPAELAADSLLAGGGAIVRPTPGSTSEITRASSDAIASARRARSILGPTPMPTPIRGPRRSCSTSPRSMASW